MKVLFVCTGNTCRSPMAEALLRHYLPGMEVKSAGIYAMNGEPANDNSRTVLLEKQIKLEHQSQPVSAALLEWADIILTMTIAHTSIMGFEHPGFQHKIATLVGYVEEEGEPVKDIADPFGGELEIYRETYKELEWYIKLLVDKLELGEDDHEEETSF